MTILRSPIRQSTRGPLRGPLQDGFGGVSFDSDALAAFAAMDVEPSDSRKLLYNDLIVSLKDAGVWSKLTWLCMFAAHDDQAGLVNLINPTLEAAVGTVMPTFTTDRGFRGASPNRALTTGQASTTVMPNQATSATMFAVLQEQSTASFSPCGYRANRGELKHGGSVPPTTRVFSVASVSATTNSADGQFVAATRNGTTIAINVNGVQEGSATAAYDNLNVANEARFLSESLTSFTNGVQAVGGFGNFLTEAECLALRNACNTYLTSIGAV
jgi:hypothetical protein